MTYSSRRLARTLKLGLAMVFLGLGGWCVLMPQTVETLSLREEFRELSATSSLFLQCFGAQAMLVGLLILMSRFTGKTFLIFGLFASVPFFGFNAWFVWGSKMFTSWMLLDFAGNVSILLIGLIGWRLMRNEPEPV